MIGISYIKIKLFRRRYRKLNKHNDTCIIGYCDISKIQIGKKTYGPINVTDWSPSNHKLIIGDYCSIAPGVQFLLGGEHNINSISTYPFKVKCFGYDREASCKGDIIVKDDVWILAGMLIYILLSFISKNSEFSFIYCIFRKRVKSLL